MLLGARAAFASDRGVPANGEVLVSATDPEAFVPIATPGDSLPDVSLIDQRGNALSLRGGAKTTIVSFVETRCPDGRTCPLVTAKFGQLHRLLHGSGIRLLELTLDPLQDRPRTLLAYATKYGVRGDDWFIGTGRAIDVASFSKRLGIIVTSPNASDPGHTEAVAILSGDGVLRAVVDGNDWSPADVAAQARDAAGLASDPLRRIALGAFARASAMCGSVAGAGLPAVAALAMIGCFTLAFAFVIVRLFAPAFSGRS